MVWAESRLEWDVIILLDHDPNVIDYCEQTLPTDLMERVHWTPDFIVKFRSGKIVIIECKYLTELIDPEKKHEYIKKYEKMRNTCEIIDIDFIVVTDKIVNKFSRVDNCRKFMEVVRERKFSHQSTIINQVLSIVGTKKGCTIKELIDNSEMWLEKTNSSAEQLVETIYQMIYFNDFSFDYEELITIHSKLFLRKRDDKFESLETWLKSSDWVKEIPPTIKQIDVVDLHSIPKKYLEIANWRYNIIAPFLKGISNAELEKISNINNVGKSTIRRWIKRYNKEKDIRSLIPRYKQRGKSLIKIDEELLEFGLNEYLKLERPSYSAAYKRMKAKARTELKSVPSYDTFRRRVKALEKEKIIKRRFGHKQKDKIYSQSIDNFPHGNWALQTVQIDHTPVDVIVVDKETRTALSRPYLTVAIDIYSRAVLGFALTFDKPSRLSIAMTILNCVQPKNKITSMVQEVYPELDTTVIENSDWNDIYGLPGTLHMDNGSDFRSKDLINFGLAYNIKLHYRPVNGPRYGAHIERFLGTLNRRLQALEGTTFSNIHEKKDYPSEKRAIYSS